MAYLFHRTSAVVIQLGAVLVLMLSAGCGDDPKPLDSDALGVPVRLLSTSAYLGGVNDLFAPLDFSSAVVPFPERTDIHGFDNNTAVAVANAQTVDAFLIAATTIALDVRVGLATVSACGADDVACVRDWLESVADRVYWSSEDAADGLLEGFDADPNDDVGAAVERVLRRMLMSPDFLYIPASVEPLEGSDQLGGMALARKLSDFLWLGLPDAELVAAARGGSLDTPEGRREQVERMLAEPRAERAVVNFYRQLLEWDRVGRAEPDIELAFPDIEREAATSMTHLTLQPAMVREAELFVVNHLFDGDGRLETLLTSNTSYPSRALMEFVYDGRGEIGAIVDTDLTVDGRPQEHVEVVFDPALRRGLLTLGVFLHGTALPQNGSPVLRGVLVRERLLCAPPPPPPPDVPGLPEPSDGNPTTNRERYAEHTNRDACRGCHEPIDGIGFAFEAYDLMGRHREFDNGVEVDETGVLLGTDIDQPVQGAIELTALLAQSVTVADCHVRNWFRYAMARSESGGDDAVLERLSEEFEASGGEILELVRQIALSDEFAATMVQP